MELTINDIREQLKIHCPGEAFHADNKTHAELIANRFMDCTAILLGEIERIEKQTAEKCVDIIDQRKLASDPAFQSIGAIRKHFTLPPPPE